MNHQISPQRCVCCRLESQGRRIGALMHELSRGKIACSEVLSTPFPLRYAPDQLFRLGWQGGFGESGEEKQRRLRRVCLNDGCRTAAVHSLASEDYRVRHSDLDKSTLR